MSNADKRLSSDGARFIADFEGTVLHPYNDGAGGIGNATIGIGHLIHMGPVTAADIRRYAGFTDRDALELLKRDVGDVERQVRELIHRELDQHAFDALVSITFNCGPAVLEGNVGQLVNEGSMRQAAAAMLAWDHAGGVVLAGLKRRREAEGRLLLEPMAAYLPSDERRWRAEHDRLEAVHRPSWAQRRRLAALERAMVARRKQIWRLAQPRPRGDGKGWGGLNRAARYRELLRRTGG